MLKLKIKLKINLRSLKTNRFSNELVRFYLALKIQNDPVMNSKRGICEKIPQFSHLSK